MSTATTTSVCTAAWKRVCAIDDIPPWCGAAALLGTTQVALLRWGDSDQVAALANFDPFSNAMVISRGIIGDLAGQRVVASPLYKQHFRLSDGVCIEDATVVLRTWPVRVIDGQVEIEI